MSRIVLVSGKGGVGKTTVAAATAVRAAELGHRTLVISLDRAHNLGDVLAQPLGPDPLELDGCAGLSACEASPQAELSRHWHTLREYGAQLLQWAGIGASVADEITVFPGLEELLLLSRLAELANADSYDLLVVDLAPTASSLRLLSFPELASGPLGRALAWERRALRVLRPALRRLWSTPLPDDDVYEAIYAFVARLAELRTVLLDPARTVVRLVTIPERVVIDETRSAFTLLAMFGFCIDAVVCNRVLPPELDQGYFARWRAIHARELARAREAFPELPLLELRAQPDEVHGCAALSRLAHELYGEHDPAHAYVDAPPLRFLDDGADTVLELRLPHAKGRGLELRHEGDALLVGIGGWRRSLPLPSSLREREVGSARFAGGVLRVRFTRTKETRP